MLRNSLQPDQGYCTTNHNLIDVIGPVLEQAKGKDCRVLRKMAEAIRMNFSSRGRSSLVRMAVFECSLISLISRTDPDHLGGTISPTWLARELSGLKKLEEALRQGWSLEAEEAAFLAAFTGLNSARYEEWLENVIIEAEWVLCILPLVRK